MQSGFRQSRYGSDKFEAIKEQTKRDGVTKRTPSEIRDLVRDPVAPLVDGHGHDNGIASYANN